MKNRGFTLIELLVVIVIIGILVAIALPNFIKIKDKAKEAEVKQNLHAIQLALERYAVDSPSSDYPLFVMGGDWTDSFVVWQDWVDQQNDLDPADIKKYDYGGNWEPAEHDVGDTLVMESYLPAAPGNPFVKNKSVTILPDIIHTDWNSDQFTRYVGGANSDKMYECFGPTYTWPGESVSGDAYVHHIFNNPPYIQSLFKDQTAAGPVDWNSPSGNTDLQGNFAYYPRPGELEGLFYMTQRQDVVGYTLIGYGSIRTPGQDCYNRTGDFKYRNRSEPCSYQCSSSPVGHPVIPCICPGDNSAPSAIKNNGGSDTLADGVVITLDSGVDKKTGKTNFDVTEGESAQ